ncbi:MAG: pitrilysin family protein [Caldimonas sp.]
MFKHALVAFGLTLFAAWAPAQTRPAPLPAGIEEVTRVEGITEYRLKNGLQLLLVPDDSKPSTTVNVTYRVGSRHESYGETGMAHLLEHLLFKGTPTTRNLLAEFTKRGLRANGSTWYDRTNYFATFAASDENLRWYLGWQADAMINSLIARADLDTEMTVVRNEMESGENSPTRVLLQQTMAAMYRWHNYGKATIGARADVENVDIPRLQAFYRNYYQPDNATLIVSGRFDSTKVLEIVAQTFGPLPRPTRTLAPTYTLDPPQDGERAVTLRRVGGAPLVYVGYHVPPAPSADFAAATLLAQVLGDTPGGRLHKQLVERQLAASTFGFTLALAEPSPLFIGAQLSPTQDVDKARAAIGATVDSLASEPVSAEELERARTQWLNDWDQGFADPERIGVALSEAIAQGDWRLYFLSRDHVRKVTVADIRRVAAERLRRDNRTVGIYLPTAQPERAPAPARVDVAALVKGYQGDPGAVQAESFDPSPANLDARTQRFVLDSGLKVALLPKGARGQAVQARLRLRFGDVTTLHDQDTVAGFVGTLLDKGGAGMTRQQIADQFDRLQAEVGFFAHGQAVNVDIRTRRDRLPAVIELVGKLLREPDFSAPALEEIRVQWLTGIERQKKEPDALIRNKLARYGNPYPRGDIRYEGSFEEDEQDVRAVTLARVAAFHRRFYSAAHGEFTAVGDFDPAAVRQALGAAFGGWKQPAGGALPYTRAPRPLLALAPARFIEVTPDRANANLRGRLPVPLMDTDADYPALLMANYLFGSGGSSRLWKRIRESGGLSYDVRSGVDWNPDEPNSSWTVSAIFAPQNQPRVEAALREELALSIKEGFSQKELDEARAGLLNRRRLGRAQDGNVASQLASDQRLGRTFAFAQRVDQAIETLSLDQVNAAWRKYIDPARVVLAWGGDFKASP